MNAPGHPPQDRVFRALALGAPTDWDTLTTIVASLENFVSRCRKAGLIGADPPLEVESDFWHLQADKCRLLAYAVSHTTPPAEYVQQSVASATRRAQRIIRWIDARPFHSAQFHYLDETAESE
jgi:hypothetical protein